MKLPALYIYTNIYTYTNIQSYTYFVVQTAFNRSRESVIYTRINMKCDPAATDNVLARSKSV